jgi:hypothetical protein
MQDVFFSNVYRLTSGHDPTKDLNGKPVNPKKYHTVEDGRKWKFASMFDGPDGSRWLDMRRIHMLEPNQDQEEDPEVGAGGGGAGWGGLGTEGKEQDGLTAGVAVRSADGYGLSAPRAATVPVLVQ